MYEEMIINKILTTKSMKVVKENGLSSENFLTCKDKLLFIEEHQQIYGVVPDTITFLAKFNDFELLNVTESDEFLSYKLKEATLYKDLVPVLKAGGDMTREDSIKAIQYLKENLDNLLKNTNLKVGRGYDIMGNGEDRLEEYKRRCEVRGLLGISTGIPMLDEYTHGWLAGEDLITIVGRTNEGKSWILLYLLVKAWMQGKRVVLYSGEMGRNIVGFRVDTMYKHFSNSYLMNGNASLMESYEEYIKTLRTNNPFIILTPTDFGGRKPTVNDLESMCEYYGADILGVDQISLMTDQRKGENKRIKFTQITEDLFALSEKLRIPVIANTQASRESVKDKKSKDQAPELDQIAESDGIPQNSSRVLSMKVIDGILKLAIKKNRYGINNKEILLRWDIDKGIINPILENSLGNSDEYGF